MIWPVHPILLKHKYSSMSTSIIRYHQFYGNPRQHCLSLSFNISVKYNSPPIRPTHSPTLGATATLCARQSLLTIDNRFKLHYEPRGNWIWTFGEELTQFHAIWQWQHASQTGDTQKSQANFSESRHLQSTYHNPVTVYSSTIPLSYKISYFHKLLFFWQSLLSIQ